MTNPLMSESRLATLTKGLNSELEKNKLAQEANRKYSLRMICDEFNAIGRYTEFGVSNSLFGNFREVKPGENTIFQTYSANSKSYIHKKYKGGVTLSEEDVEDEQLSAFLTRAPRDAMTAYLNELEQSIVTVLTTSNVSVVDNGPNFFTSSGDNANNLTGVGTSDAQIAADLSRAWATISKFKDDAGRNLTIPRDKLMIVCPVELQHAMERVVKSRSLDSNTFLKNPLPDYFKSENILGSSYLTDTNDYYVCIVDGAIKPIFLAKREDINIQSNLYNRERDEATWTARARWVTGPANRLAICKITNA